jgi:hypothetical protein
MLNRVTEAVWADGTFIRIRAATLAEVQQALHLPDPQAVRNLWIYNKLLLHGPPEDIVPAGVVAWVGKQAIDLNPFSGGLKPLQTAIENARARLAASYLENARALVAGTFRYSFEEIDTWTAEVFFLRLAAAEFLVGNRMDPQDPQTAPAPVKPAQTREQRKQQIRQFHKERTDSRR